ncbi:glycosyltransferase family 2 protein [Calothrix sp. UHCC 0171]|uniref:glycosyltransferase family 2 protein n=1 Tax=Calothrix sp. UHCC 0171 TaxID=3110245 RepID=UPI002B1EE562|nr:glycosyltransferase family 2 protein [Calothrix sp. UHCC 0171]MEA5573374.1 glycosyltransferase family 2 protein [Calothrix sp. UHCC 0171]
MTAKCDISFIIVSHNSAKTLRGSIESCLMAVETYSSSLARVVVYDNASSDDSPKIMNEFAQKYPDTFIGIQGIRNLGFARGNNQAVAASPSREYVLVNPDVVFQPETIKYLQNTLYSAPDIAIVCPKLLHLDRTLQKSIRRFPTFTYLFLKHFIGEKFLRFIYTFDYYYAEMPQPKKAVEINWGIGAFMMISGEYIAKYGLFDERFFLYFEDVSLCVDAWQNGYRVLYQPQASALHLYRQASTSSKFNYLTFIHIISALKFFAKYRPYQIQWQVISWLIRVTPVWRSRELRLKS